MGTFDAGLNAFCTVIWLQSYRDHRVEHGDLNDYGPHRPIKWEVRRYGSVEVGVVLLKGVLWVGWALSFRAQGRLNASLSFCCQWNQI